MRTVSPSPAPTRSTQTNVRPTPTSDACDFGSMRSGSTVSSFWPTSDATLCVETTLPVTFARNIAASLAFDHFKRLPSDDDLFVRRHRPDRDSARILRHDHLALGGCVLRVVDLNPEIAKPVTDRG